MNLGKQVMVALSGGVDSAVTAALLMEQGFDVVGVYMQLLSGDEHADDAAGARQVANELAIPLHILDCREQFAEQVVDNFCNEYKVGRTPNPCILCNKYLKFGYLLQFADELGIEYLATGHYACVDTSGAYPLLRRGTDLAKDQSYFLFTLTAEQLARVMFPLATTTKQEVLDLAQRFKLSARHSGESQDICFIPNNDYVSFLAAQNLDLPAGGDIIHVDGMVLGQHNGTHCYTIGQRRGLGIGWSEPLYVVAIDAAKKQVIVGENGYLEKIQLQVKNVVWAHSLPPANLRVDCRIRYRHREALATIEVIDNGTVLVLFDEAQTGVTPGQSAVFYQNDCVLGGGWIE
jgi:tRNA-specific 2-thiouridylase